MRYLEARLAFRSGVVVVLHVPGLFDYLYLRRMLHRTGMIAMECWLSDDTIQFFFTASSDQKAVIDGNLLVESGGY